MPDRNDLSDAALPRYRSSAAARMVNIPVATLRVWERRYNVIGPAQTVSGHRLYSSQDVRRLVMIKQLVNKGHAISMLAALSTARLQEMWQEVEQVQQSMAQSQRPRPTAASAPMQESEHARIVLVGPGALARWGGLLQGMAGLNLVAAIDDVGQVELDGAQLAADVLVADLGSVHMDTVERLDRIERASGARQTIVIHGFASTQVLEALRARAVVLRRAPVGPAEFQSLITETLRGWRSVAQALRRVPDPAPPARLDYSNLSQLLAAMPKVACECPAHLAELITLLGQFEAYSADCESRHPADVALHAYLYRVAGHARALMEEALVTLAMAEGVAPAWRNADNSLGRDLGQV